MGWFVQWLLDDVGRRLARLERTTMAHDRLITRMEKRMTSAEDAQYDRLRVLTGLIKAEFASLKQQIADAQASTDEAVAGALSADATADAERLSGLLDELAAEVPGDVPDVPVPDPGQPAEEPGDGSNPVPVPGE